MNLNVGDERQVKNCLFHKLWFLFFASGPISLERINDKLTILFFICILLFFCFLKNTYNNNNSVNLSALKQDVFLSFVCCLELNMIGSACLFAQTSPRPRVPMYHYVRIAYAGLIYVIWLYTGSWSCLGVTY